ERHAMPIGRPNREFAQSPGLRRRLGNNRRAARSHFLMQLVHAVDDDVRDVGMTAELARGPLVRTLAEHHLEVAARKKGPVITGLAAEVSAEAEDVQIEPG